MASPYEFVSATVKNFRSIGELTISFEPGKITTICGQNNVGKTNFLRALNLFFSLDKKRFQPDIDIPYHVEKGSRGSGFKTTIIGEFREVSTKKRMKIRVEYIPKKDDVQLVINGDEKVLKTFRFFFIEASNIDLPSVISDVFINDVLPGLDKLRARQNRPLELLKDFFDSSEQAVSEIERSITTHVKSFVERVPGLETKDWTVKVQFSNLIRCVKLFRD